MTFFPFTRFPDVTCVCVLLPINNTSPHCLNSHWGRKNHFEWMCYKYKYYNTSLKQIRRLTKVEEEQYKNPPLGWQPRHVHTFLVLAQCHLSCKSLSTPRALSTICWLLHFLCICFNRLSWWEPIREADVKWQQEYEEGWLGQADIGNSQRGIWAIQRWIIKGPNNTGINNIDVNTLNSWILLRWIIKELKNMGLNNMDLYSFLKLNN